jgi:hypothetical protein
MRASWKIHPCPDQRASLVFGESYGSAEFERITAGFVPVAMEDKWFMFFEEPWLYIHRSWTGSCIYGVRFESSQSGVTEVEAWVSRDANQYREARSDDDRTLLKFLIDALLLGKNVAFPVPTNTREADLTALARSLWNADMGPIQELMSA